jgi:CRP/FNR family transcriptional regulator
MCVSADAGGFGERGLMSDRPATASVSHMPGADHFEAFCRLSPEEQAAVSDALEPLQSWPRHHVIRREGAAPTHLYLLVEGWVASSITLASGRQQIIKIHLPNDLLGLPSLPLVAAVDGLSALTAVAVRAIPRARLMSILMRYPRIATSMFLGAQKERVALMESLAVMGQEDAAIRIAAMLVSLHDRLAALGWTSQGAFRLPLTQREIGDLVGITPVHVNRTLREFDRLSLIRRSEQRIALLDIDRLRRMASLPAREIEADPGWISWQG